MSIKVLFTSSGNLAGFRLIYQIQNYVDIFLFGENKGDISCNLCCYKPSLFRLLMEGGEANSESRLN